MKPALIKKRDQIVEPLWQALESTTQANAPEVLSAARAVIGKLEELLQKTDEATDPLESGKTYKFLGDAYYTLAAKKDQALLATAREMYGRGEQLLKSTNDQLALAKLNFNLGNTLCLLGYGLNRANLKEARGRYTSALQVFRTAQPDAVPGVSQSLEAVELKIALLEEEADLNQT